MISQRLALRAAAQLRTPATRQAFQKRFSSSGGQFEGAADNAFNKERLAGKAHAASTSDLWRKLSIYGVIPCVIVACVNAKVLWDAHWSHWDHMEPLEERTEYPYQNMRVKNFFWGDGDKTAFWNPSVNHHKKDE